jgi:hypothetical protein
MTISSNMIPESNNQRAPTARKLAERNTALAVSFARLASSGNAVAETDNLGVPPEAIVQAHKIEGAAAARESAARAAYLIGSEPSILTVSQSTIFSPKVRGLLETL